MIATHPFAMIAMDFVELPTVQRGHETFDYIYVIVDRLSGYILGFPTQKAGLTSTICADIFYSQVLCQFGLPLKITSDQDVRWTSKFWQALIALTGIEHATTLAYRPQGNGRAERAVQSIIQMLRMLLATWLQILPLALWNINTTPGILGLSPFEIIYGYTPMVLGDQPALPAEFTSKPAETWLQDRMSQFQNIQQLLIQAQQADRIAFNKKHSVPPTFQVGELVWYRGPNAHSANLDKLSTKWTGPCEILAITRPNHYSISVSPEKTLEVHVQYLKLCLAPKGVPIPLHGYSTKEQIPETPMRTYEVSKILGYKLINKVPHWLVNWKGCPNSDNSWQPLTDFIQGYNSLWLSYNKKHKITVDLTTQKLPNSIAL